MTSMIESLIGSSIRRHDRKVFVGAKRVAPTTPRELFDLLMSLGRQTTLQAIWQAADWSDIDPRDLVFAVLNRWPSTAELEALPADYEPRLHLRQILTSGEFRQHLARRICDTYPERPRQLYVHVPRCAGAHFVKTIGAAHPIFPERLIEKHPKDSAEFVVALGSYLARFHDTRTILLVQPRLADFIDTPNASWSGDHSLTWSVNAPVRRGGDRLFTIVRDPGDILLSRVNTIIKSLQTSNNGDEGETAPAWYHSAPAGLPTDDIAAWQALGLEILTELADENPICSALGDGTASSALEACQTSNIEIADLARYRQWLLESWDTTPDLPSQGAPSILTYDRLSKTHQDLIADRTAEDRIFYTRFRHAMEAASEPSIKGAAL